jgi:hypothetical protein
LDSVAVGRTVSRHTLNVAFHRALNRTFRHVLAVLEEILKQLAIIDHRLSKVLGRGHAAAMTNRNLARGAVVLDDAAMMYRQIGGALIEVGYRIAARLHHLFDQSVGASHRAARIIDEHCLYVPPLLRERTALLGRERPNLQGVHSLLTPHQFILGATLIADLADGSRVLGPIQSAKILRAATLHGDVPRCDTYHYDRDENPDNRSCAHDLLPRVMIRSVDGEWTLQLRCQRERDPCGRVVELATRASGRDLLNSGRASHI